MNQQYYNFLLSQVFGLFMFIFAVIVMSRMHFYRKIILQLKADNPVIVLGGILGLFIGIILVVSHTVWTTRASLWISLFAWFTFLMSIFWLALPERMLSLAKKMCSGIGYYWVIVFLLVFGILVIGRGVQLLITHPAAMAMHA